MTPGVVPCLPGFPGTILPCTCHAPWHLRRKLSRHSPWLALVLTRRTAIIWPVYNAKRSIIERDSRVHSIVTCLSDRCVVFVSRPSQCHRTTSLAFPIIKSIKSKQRPALSPLLTRPLLRLSLTGVSYPHRAVLCPHRAVILLNNAILSIVNPVRNPEIRYASLRDPNENRTKPKA